MLQSASLSISRTPPQENMAHEFWRERRTEVDEVGQTIDRLMYKMYTIHLAVKLKPGQQERLHREDDRQTSCGWTGSCGKTDRPAVVWRSNQIPRGSPQPSVNIIHSIHTK